VPSSSSESDFTWSENASSSAREEASELDWAMEIGAAASREARRVSVTEMGAATSASSAHSMHTRMVYEDNLLAELNRMLAAVAQGYRFIAIDTEYPGIVFDAKPRDRRLTPEETYLQMRANVNGLKAIQLGCALFNAEGERFGGSCFQFHFHFNVERDLISPEALEVLSYAGVDWGKHRTRGIPEDLFGQLAHRLGLHEILASPSVHWICFHGVHDFFI